MTTALTLVCAFIFATVGGYLLEKYVRRPLLEKMKDSKLKRILLKRIN